MKTKNMRLLIFLFFLFLIIPIIHSIVDKRCPIHSCGKNYFTIQYPFKLQGQNPKICNNYIDLKCAPQNNTILNLPFSGEFYVFDIFYYTKSITLNDPENCLPRRLINLNLSSSPFLALKYEDYTFYSCPETTQLISDGYVPIRCLSTYPNVTVASSSEVPGNMIRAFNCSVIDTAKIPVEYFGQFESYAIISDLRLTWDFPSCDDCEKQVPGETDQPGSKLSKFIGSSAFIPLVVIFGMIFGISCFVFLNKMIAARNEAHSTTTTTTTPEVALMLETTTNAAVSLPQSTVDYSIIKTYIVSEFREEFNIGTSGLNYQGISSCTICLEEYMPQETIRCIILCQHYFHANCIDQWFQKNSSCPVCRTSLADVNFGFETQYPASHQF